MKLFCLSALAGAAVWLVPLASAAGTPAVPPPAAARAVAPAPAFADPEVLAAEGNRAYRAGDPAAAVLAWERAVLLDPAQPAARAGLAVAGRAGLVTPRPTLTEAYAQRFSRDTWVALAVGGGWFAILAMFAPWPRRFRRGSHLHFGAALGVTVALLALPGLLGAFSREKLAVVVTADAPVFLTPTVSGELLLKLSPGDRVRLVPAPGHPAHRQVATSDGTIGWMRVADVVPVVPAN